MGINFPVDYLGEAGERIEVKNIGVFGDFFGGLLNPLISFCALIAIVKTFELQKNELSSTQNSLRENIKNAQISSFNDMFFLLLGQVKQMEEKINIGNGLIDLHIRCIGGATKKANESQNLLIKNIAESKQKVLESVDFNSYATTLYQLLKYIKEACPEFNESGRRILVEKRYSNIVRATIRAELLQLIAVNVYYEDDKGNKFYSYYSLICRYGFLEHMPLHDIKKHQTDLGNNVLDYIKENYAESAFGKSDYYSEFKKKIKSPCPKNQDIGDGEVDKCCTKR